MYNKILFLIIAVVVMLAGCEAERNLIPNAHDGRVPDILDLTYKVDTNASRQKVITLRWRYDSLKYGTDRIAANLRDWEIYRSANDTAQFTSRGKTFFPIWVDSSPEVQPAGRDSVIIFYKIFPNGYPVDNIQFVGRPSEILRIIVRK